MTGVRQISLGDRIRKFRLAFEFSQEDLAARIGIPRPSLSGIEAGKREVTSTELIKLAGIFDISVDELLGPENAGIEEVESEYKVSPAPSFNKEKFKQVLLYVLGKCGAKPNVGETVLYKLLYFIDFNYYELFEEPLMGESYRRIKFGPVPCHFNSVVDEMIEAGEIKKLTADYYGQRQKKYLPLIFPDLSDISAGAKQVIDSVLDNLSSKDAATLTNYSLEDMPWKMAQDKEIIDYESVFYRTPAYSVRSYSGEM
jgi:transcriptional regulator with XRE-family HTH domain